MAIPGKRQIRAGFGKADEVGRACRRVVDQRDPVAVDVRDARFGLKAGDPNDPESTFDVALYQIETGSDQKIDFFSLQSLDPGASVAQTISFAAPLTPGAYIYGAVADDANAIAESDETNNWADTFVELIVQDPNQAEPNQPPAEHDITITRFIAIPGRADTSGDILIVRGTFGPGDLTQDDLAAGVLSFKIKVGGIGVFSTDVIISGVLRASGLLLFRGLPGDVSLVIINLNNQTFMVMAQNVDLTGLKSPLTVEFDIGNFAGRGAWTQDNISHRFLRGAVDTLVVESATFLPGILAVRGKITVADTTIDLKAMAGNPTTPVLVTMDDWTLPFTAGEKAVSQVGNTSKYIYLDPTTVNGIYQAILDLDLCAYHIIVKSPAIEPITDKLIQFGLSFGNSYSAQTTYQL